MRLAAASLLALLLLAPVVGAEHVFSHRVYVVGRVLDADGRPAPGLAVNVTFEGLVAGGRCFDAKPEATGAQGDFEVCRHAHEVGPGARVVVRVANATHEAVVDPDLRHAVALVRLDAPREARDVEGDIHFSRSLLVAGRAFTLLTEPYEEEGVRVTAAPAPGNLTAELLANGTVVATKQGRANEHGLYSFALDVEALPPGALLRVRAGPEGSEVAVDPTWRRVDVNLVRDLRLEGPGEDAPGSARTPLGAWSALVALVAGLALSGGAACRSRSRR